VNNRGPLHADLVNSNGPEGCMDNVTFGITMLICGMGGTILTLWIMSLVMRFLGRLFPEKPEKKEA